MADDAWYASLLAEATERAWTTALAPRASAVEALSAVATLSCTKVADGASCVLRVRSAICPISLEPHDLRTSEWRVLGSIGMVVVSCPECAAAALAADPAHWATRARAASDVATRAFFRPGIYSTAGTALLRAACEDLCDRQPLVFRRAALTDSRAGSTDFVDALLHTNLLSPYRACDVYGWYALDPIKLIWINTADVPNRLLIMAAAFSNALAAVALAAVDAGVFPGEFLPEASGHSPTRKKARTMQEPMDDGSQAEEGSDDEDGDEKERKRVAAARLRLKRKLESCRAARSGTGFGVGACKAMKGRLVDRHPGFSEGLDVSPSLRAFADGWAVDMALLRPGAPISSAIRRTRPEDMMSVCFGANWEARDDAITTRLQGLLSGVLDVPHLDAGYPTPLSQNWLATLGAALHGNHAATGGMVFMYGYGPTGRSGKTTFGELILASWGGYAASVVGHIIAHNSDSDREPFLVSARKAILLVCTEVGDIKFHPERVNKLTGGGIMTARTLYGKPCSIPSNWALLAFSNCVLQWIAVNGGTMRRQRAIPWRTMAVPEADMDKDLLPPVPADRRLRVVEDAGLMAAVKHDPRYATAMIILILEAWRTVGVSPTGALLKVEPHPLVVAESVDQQLSNPFDLWFDATYRLTSGPVSSFISKDDAYKEYLDAHAKEKGKMSKKEFGMIMAKITRVDDADDLEDGAVAVTRIMKEYRNAKTRFWCIRKLHDTSSASFFATTSAPLLAQIPEGAPVWGDALLLGLGEEEPQS